MADRKPLASGGMLRFIYYVISAACFFFVLLLAITMAPDRIDQELILTLIISILLLTFMLHNSQLLTSISKRLDKIAEQLKSDD